MHYYSHDENQLEKAKKDAIIKKLRDEVDEMKVKYCLKDRINKPSREQTSPVLNEVEEMNMLNNEYEDLQEMDNDEPINNNFNYNNLSPKNDVFDRKFKVIDYNKFNTDEYNNMDEPCQDEINENQDYENEEYEKEEPTIMNNERVRPKDDKSSNFYEDKVYTLENEQSSINKYNFTKPVEKQLNKTAQLNSNKYNKRDVYSEYKKELNDYASNNNQNNYSQENMKRAKSLKNGVQLNISQNKNTKNLPAKTNNKSMEKGEYFKKYFKF